MLTETSAECGASGALAARARRCCAPACTLLGGCGTTPYLLQAACGQWHVMHAREPIDTRASPIRTPRRAARAARPRCAQRATSPRSELGLPDNKSYRSYADIEPPLRGVERGGGAGVLGRPRSTGASRWPAASPTAATFTKQAAREFAARAARAQGYDVSVDGVPAYSTLGKFADPVLSSLLRYGDDDVAATIFHELAHQLLYVQGRLGLQRGLRHHGRGRGARALAGAPGRRPAHAGVSRRAGARGGVRDAAGRCAHAAGARCTPRTNRPR